MQAVPLFVELCAGLASVSGVLQHGPKWKPPVSRMGRKTGYAEPILDIMGLRPRQKAERYLWAEADGDVAALLAAYTQPEVMREIAATIRSWIPCPYGDHPPDPSCSRCKETGRWDARDLWEVLRREKRRGLWEGFDPASVATFCSTSYLSRPGEIGSSFKHSAGGGWPDDPPDLANMPLVALPWPPVLIAQDAAVDVGSVAGWVVTGRWSYRDGEPESGFAEAMVREYPRTATDHGRKGRTLLQAAERLEGEDWPAVHLTPSAAFSSAAVPPGAVVYIDPPYLNTTGYKADFSRAQVCEAAERWAAAGARVYISEAEPIEALGWHHVEITGERRGQARTFGATREFLTCSHPPRRRQAALFARAA